MRGPSGKMKTFILYRVLLHLRYYSCTAVLYGHLLYSYRYRGPSWPVLGPSWGHLGPSWGPLGTNLGPSWALLGPSWALLGPSWAILGPSGPLLGPLLADIGQLYVEQSIYRSWIASSIDLSTYWALDEAIHRPNGRYPEPLLPGPAECAKRVNPPPPALAGSEAC